MDSTRPIRALMRGLETLCAINAHDGATVADVVHTTRLPRTTVYRLLGTLCEAGYAQRDPLDDRYRVTPRVHRLALRVPIRDGDRVLAALNVELGEFEPNGATTARFLAELQDCATRIATEFLKNRVESRRTDTPDAAD